MLDETTAAARPPQSACAAFSLRMQAAALLALREEVRALRRDLDTVAAEAARLGALAAATDAEGTQ